MARERHLEQGQLELKVYAIEKDSQAIKDAFIEAEKALGIESHIVVGKHRIAATAGAVVATGLTTYLVVITTEFAKGFAKKFGESVADWLSRKLKLNEIEGEKIVQNPDSKE